MSERFRMSEQPRNPDQERQRILEELSAITERYLAERQRTADAINEGNIDEVMSLYIESHGLVEGGPDQQELRRLIKGILGLT